MINLGDWRLTWNLSFYLRYRLIVNATHRNSLMSGSGRQFTGLWDFSSVEETEILASSACFSFCPRVVNHSTWSRSIMAPSSCWSRFLRRIISKGFCRKYKTDWRNHCSNMNVHVKCTFFQASVLSRWGAHSSWWGYKLLWLHERPGTTPL